MKREEFIAQTVAIPAGEWEICFRPALIDKSSLIMQGAVQGKPN
jgi:hypothetical protein